MTQEEMAKRLSVLENEREDLLGQVEDLTDELMEVESVAAKLPGIILFLSGFKEFTRYYDFIVVKISSCQACEFHYPTGPLLICATHRAIVGELSKKYHGLADNIPTIGD